MKIILKTLIYFYSFLSFFKRKVLIKNIKKDDLVLDVGSGDKPHWRADVIVDKFPEDNHQRATGKILLDQKRFYVNADVENLPFKDRAFDFVFCSHLLEHVEDPGQAIKEITRVGKAGYLEVPFAGLDLLKPFKSHLWFCFLDKGRLIFFRRDAAKNFYTAVLEKFGEKYFESPFLQYLFIKDFPFFFISLYWRDPINCQVINQAQKPYVYSARRSRSAKMKIDSFLYRLFYFLMVWFFYRKKKINQSRIMK